MVCSGKNITVDDVLSSEEVILTNALRGIIRITMGKINEILLTMRTSSFSKIPEGILVSVLYVIHAKPFITKTQEMLLELFQSGKIKFYYAKEPFNRD